MNREINHRVSLFKIVAFSLIPLVALLLFGELFSRVWLYFKNKDIFYLTGPFFEKKQVFEKAEKQTLKEQVNYELRVDNFNHRNRENWYFKAKPGSYPPPPRYQYGNFTINSLGFRGKEFKPFDKNGKIRIFCLGDSSTFGMESSDNQIWTARLDYYLNRNTGSKYEVINAGFPGYYSLNYFNLIRFELINYKPDIFIIYSAATELNRNLIEKKVNRVAKNFHELLYYRSMLYTLVVEKISVIFRNTPIPMNLYDSKPTENYIDRMEKIINLCSANKIKLIMVRNMLLTSRDLFLCDNLPLEEIDAIGKKSQYDKGGQYDPDTYYHAGYLTIYRLNEMMQPLIKLCLKHNIELLDFRKEFYKVMENGEILFNDDVHLTPGGNDILGKLISQNILGAAESQNFVKKREKDGKGK